MILKHQLTFLKWRNCVSNFVFQKVKRAGLKKIYILKKFTKIYCQKRGVAWATLHLYQ